MDVAIQKHWYQLRIVRASAIITVVCACALMVAYLMSSTHMSVPSSRITTASTTLGMFRPTILVSGTVEPNKTIYIDAVVGGQVKSVQTESGSYVKAGDTIIILSNTSLMLNVMGNQANLIEQQTNLRNTRLAIEQNSLSLASELMRIENELAETSRRAKQQDTLFAKGYISSNEYYDLKERHSYLTRLKDITRERVARDSLFQVEQLLALQKSSEKIEANLLLADQSLEALVIRAPETGLLLQMDVRVGESISPGQRLAQIDASDGFKVTAEVDEYYLQNIYTGLRADMSIEDRNHVLSIAKVHPEVDNGRFSIELQFNDSAPDEITRGQTVHLKLYTGTESEALLLRRGPYYEQTAGQWVFVLSEDESTAERREITLGRQNSEMFEVLSGLRKGDRVIISSYERIKDESILRIESH